MTGLGTASSTLLALLLLHTLRVPGSALARGRGGGPLSGCRSPVVPSRSTISFAPGLSLSPKAYTNPGNNSGTTEPRKFLLLLCWSGQVSNLQRCVYNHVLLAGFLSRTLVVPAKLMRWPDRTYDTRVFFDLEHVRRCLGPNTAMSAEEFLKLQRTQKGVDARPEGAPSGRPGAGRPRELKEAEEAGARARHEEQGVVEQKDKEQGQRRQSGSVEAEQTGQQPGEGQQQQAQRTSAEAEQGTKQPGRTQDLEKPRRNTSVDAEQQQKEAQRSKNTGMERQAGLEVWIDHIHCLSGPAEVCTNYAGSDSVTPQACPFRVAAPHGSQFDPASFQYPVREDLLAAISVTTGMGLNASQASLAAECFPNNVEAHQVITALTKPEAAASSVLVVGDLLPFNFQDKHDVLLPHLIPRHLRVWVPHGGVDYFKRLPGCPARALVIPPEPVLALAHQARREMFGRQTYVSVHWRRDDFATWCVQLHKQNCILTAEQAAWYAADRAKVLGIPRVFLATNANEAEVAKFTKALKDMYDGPIQLGHLTKHKLSLISLPEDGIPGVKNSEQEHLIRLVVDKLICMMGSVFLGSPISNFTMDIYRMRVGFGLETSCDERMGSKLY